MRGIVQSFKWFKVILSFIERIFESFDAVGIARVRLRDFNIISDRGAIWQAVAIFNMHLFGESIPCIDVASYIHHSTNFSVLVSWTQKMQFQLYYWPNANKQTMFNCSLTWHWKLHASAFDFRKIGRTFGLAILLTVQFKESQLPFGLEEASSIRWWVATQSVRCHDDIWFDGHINLLFNWNENEIVRLARQFILKYFVANI